MALPQILPDVYVPTFAMKVEGVPLDPLLAKSITEISVSDFLGPPSQFRFRLNDPKMSSIDPMTGCFTEGTKIEIELGFVGNTRSMIVGEISAVAVDFPSSGPVTVEVEGYDLLHRLTRGTTYRTFYGTNPGDGVPHSQIVSQILDDASLQSSVDPDLSESKPKVQDHVNDLVVLEQLARDDGYFLWMDGETVYFQSEPLQLPGLTLEWGKTLMSFSPRLSTVGQVNSVEVRGWDPVQKQSVTGRAQSTSTYDSALAPSGLQQVSQGAGGNSEMVVQEAGVTSDDEAQDRADLLLFEQRQALVTGNGTSVGQPDMRVGATLTLNGIGRFTGDYVVRRVTHSLGASGYQTSFEVNQKIPKP
jgi:uncharacterized protein